MGGASGDRRRSLHDVVSPGLRSLQGVRALTGGRVVPLGPVRQIFQPLRVHAPFVLRGPGGIDRWLPGARYPLLLPIFRVSLTVSLVRGGGGFPSAGSVVVRSRPRKLVRPPGGAAPGRNIRNPGHPSTHGKRGARAGTGGRGEQKCRCRRYVGTRSKDDKDTRPP